MAGALPMGLLEYKKKRTLKKTPEPAGGRAKGNALRFVVQKHDASHLHYDFRLEMEGVLKSWAVPKGPSMDPKIKRLAMQVEDHPYDYRTFEGIIPEGNYGAGTVMVWDEGTYHIVGKEFNTKRAEDAELLKQWEAGKIHFILEGTKLKGEFALVKAAWRGDKSWLLMKLKDEHATTDDILLADKSAVTQRTLDEISSKKKSRKTSARKAVASRKTKIKMPPGITPMLTTLVDKPFDRPGWIYEIKWDGYRALAFINNGKVELKSRNDKSFNDKFYPVYRALEEWDVNAIVDGEVVVLKSNGLSDFGSLQNWRSEADGDLVYFVFDVLWRDGKDLRKMPLAERKKVLSEIMPQDSGIIRLSEAFDVKGTDFYESAKRMGLEGIVAKKADSPYQSGLRTNDWLKIKVNQRQEVVIGGYTRNAGSSKPFSALLVGVFEDGRFKYTGKIGTGFKDLQQREMLKQFAPYETDKPQFSETPDYNKPSRFNPKPAKASVTWLKPKLVCEVSFAEMTTDGVMRHPSFEGMRIDKGAKEVTREKPKPTEKVVPARDRSTLLNPKDETQVREVEGYEIKFTNLSKVYWPKAKMPDHKKDVTKRDMLNYYYQVAPYILPYLEDRPMSLNRFPNGITGKGFYQKDVTGKVPDWVETYLYHRSDEPDVDRHYLIPRTEADVMLMASMGCIEMHPWSSRTESPDNPDWCLIDLDPGKTTFDQVVEAALVTKQILDDKGLPNYCKTSGSTGLHIYVPLDGKFTYEDSKEFARALVTLVHKEIPSFTSIERIVTKRKGKMYLDFLQNRPQATLAAPYSLRPKPGAPVSMPLHWEEVKKGLKITDFNIFNAVDRIREVGDLFKPLLAFKKNKKS
ncbi:MAG TPA: DNA ligase D [Cyclobacteriaceae bacterium]|nr:DNA ligase D [Cyclobacteriaceae bacterium]